MSACPGFTMYYMSNDFDAASSNHFPFRQGRIMSSAGPGAVQNAGPLQTYSQLTTPTNCGPPKLGARVLQHP